MPSDGQMSDGRYHLRRSLREDGNGPGSPPLDLIASEVDRALKGTPPFNDPLVGYDGLIGGPEVALFIFSVEPEQATVDALDAYFLAPVYTASLPSEASEWAAKSVDEKLDYLATKMGIAI